MHRNTSTITATRSCVRTTRTTTERLSISHEAFFKFFQLSWVSFLVWMCIYLALDELYYFYSRTVETIISSVFIFSLLNATIATGSLRTMCPRRRATTRRNDNQIAEARRDLTPIGIDHDMALGVFFFYGTKTKHSSKHNDAGHSKKNTTVASLSYVNVIDHSASARVIFFRSKFGKHGSGSRNDHGRHDHGQGNSHRGSGGANNSR